MYPAFLSWIRAYLFWRVIGACIPGLYANAYGDLFLASATPPKGFETLTDPWDTMVDVYYGSRYLLSTTATVYPGSIEFKDPVAIVRKIPHVSDPVAVTAALTGRLASHADKICRHGAPSEPNKQDCGWITPEIAGVIFDEQRFRATVFVSPAFVETSALPARLYLPPPTAMGMGFIQRLSVSSSGAWSGGSQSVLYGETYLSRGENDLESGWDIASGQGAHLSSLYVDRDYEGVDLRGGYMRTMGFGFSFTPDRPVIGVHAGTSENTYVDLFRWKSTTLDVFLPTRGRVEVFKDGLLLQAWMLDAGSHPVNTSAFPSGAYDLTIKVFGEDNQLISEETRFFVNQPGLPPAGIPFWFIEAGRVVEQKTRGFRPELTDLWLLRGGYSRRLGNRWGGTLAVAATESASLAELGGQWVSQYLNFSPSYLISSKGDRGYRLSGQFQGSAGSLGFGYRKLSVKGESEPVLFGSNTRSLSAHASMQLWHGLLQYRYLRTGSISASGHFGYLPEQHTLSYSRALFQDRRFQLDGRLEAMTAADERRLLLSLELRSRTGVFQQSFNTRLEQWQRPGYGRETTPGASYDIAYNDMRMDRSRFNGHGWGTVFKDYWGAGINTHYMGRQGSVNGSVSYSQFTGKSQNTSSGAWAAGAVTNISIKNGRLVWGGDYAAHSMLVVQVNDAPRTAEFSILVNGQARGYTRGKLASVLSLAPFETYRVRLQAGGKGLYDYEDDEREITLYPGNVALLSFNARPVKLLFGQLQAEDGSPLDNLVVSGGGSRTVSDSLGLYQLEVPFDTEEVTVRDGERIVATFDVTFQVADKDLDETLMPVINLGIKQIRIMSLIRQ